MSTLYISEYATYGVDPNSGAAVGMEPSFDQVPITIGATQTTAPNFQRATRLVRVHTDAICSINFGGPATTANKRLAANQTEYFAVVKGGNMALSVIANT